MAVSEALEYVADHWENRCGYKSAVLSGIYPDEAHQRTGGYHPTVKQLRAFGLDKDYSNVRPDDRNFNVDYCAAIDMSMSTADMKRCYKRVRRVWDDRSDTRRRYLNAINSWKGSGDATRMDFFANTVSWASADHKWHNHLEFRRRWVLSMTAAKAIVSVLKGESHAAWLKSQKPAAAPTKPKEDDDMPTAKEIADAVWNADIIKNPAWRHDAPPHGKNTHVQTKYAVERILEGHGAEVMPTLREITATQEAILKAQTGVPAEEILAGIRANTAHLEAVTAQVAEVTSQLTVVRGLVEAVGRGERDAADVVDEIGRRLTAATHG